MIKTKEDLHELIINDGYFIISEGTLRTCDLIPAFLNIIRILSYDDYEALIEDIPAAVFDEDGDDNEWWDCDEAHYMLNEDMFEILANNCPDDFYFGTSEGNGSCFGFFFAEDED